MPMKAYGNKTQKGGALPCIQRRMAGLALRKPGRPRDERAPRRVLRLSQRLQQAQSESEVLRQQGQDREQAAEEACQCLLLGLLFHGASLRSAAECLKLAFGGLAPAKTTLAQRLITLCAAAEQLFETHFAGRGKSRACDEIYLSGHPVLEVVEPRSLAITGLSPDRAPSAEAWEQLLEIFAELEAGASAQGLGVSAALAKKVARHALDLWHLLRQAHTFRPSSRAWRKAAANARARFAPTLTPAPCWAGSTRPRGPLTCTAVPRRRSRSAATGKRRWICYRLREMPRARWRLSWAFPSRPHTWKPTVRSSSRSWIAY